MRQLLPLWSEVLDNSAIPMTLFRTPYCTDTRVESGNPSIRRPPHTHIIRVPEIPRFPGARFRRIVYSVSDDIIQIRIGPKARHAAGLVREFRRFTAAPPGRYASNLNMRKATRNLATGDWESPFGNLLMIHRSTPK